VCHGIARQNLQTKSESSKTFVTINERRDLHISTAFMKIDAIAEIKKKFVENFFLPKVHALGIERDNTANESRPGNLHVGKK
jgi:hypothetical protein